MSIPGGINDEHLAINPYYAQKEGKEKKTCLCSSNIPLVPLSAAALHYYYNTKKRILCPLLNTSKVDFFEAWCDVNIFVGPDRNPAKCNNINSDGRW